MIAKISSKVVDTEIGANSLVKHVKKCLKNVLDMLKGGENLKRRK